MLGISTAYNPGYWFNSAKFLDIEYQTYGTVLSKLRNDESEFYWEHPNRKLSVHIVYRTSDKKFIGINTFGIRMRHVVFNQWLQENRTVDHVMAHLRGANFDPEFFKSCEDDIIATWNAQHPDSKVILHDKHALKQIIFGQ
jgi:hypothetical protein